MAVVLDKWYTSEQDVEICWQLVRDTIGISRNFVEPFAGNGAFLRDNLNIEAFDILPERKDIIQRDFFSFKEDDFKDKSIITNPPYGKNSSIALKSIHHGFKCGAEYICLILPLTFKKKLYMANKVGFKYVDSCEISSVFLGKKIPSYFQILKSEKIENIEVDNIFKEVPPEDSNIFVRRVGGRAGQTVESYNKNTTYSIKATEKQIELLYKYKKQIIEEAKLTVGVRSITLKEISYIITEGEKNV